MPLFLIVNFGVVVNVEKRSNFAFFNGYVLTPPQEDIASSADKAVKI